MNNLHLLIMVTLLILCLLYVNWRLNLVKPVGATDYSKDNVNRYEATLKEHFVINPKELNDLKAEVDALNKKNDSINTAKLDSNIKGIIVDSVNNSIKSNNKEQQNVNVSTISNNFIKDDETIDSMLHKLGDMEHMCEKIDKEQKIKDDLEQISINKSALQELDAQEQRIEELGVIVTYMRTQKKERDHISNQCRANKQSILNKNSKKVDALSNAGFLKDETQSVNINMPEDGIKFDLSDLTDKINEIKQNQRNSNRNRNTPKKCRQKPGFPLSKLDNGVCHKCNPNTLRKDIELINKDFKKN